MTSTNVVTVQRLLASGKLHEAEIQGRLLVELNPKDPDALRILGTVAFTRRKYADAVTLFERALTLNPAAAIVYCDLAAALGKSGHPAKAVAILQRALPLQGRVPELHNNLGVALDQLGRSVEAIATFRNALKLRPDFPEAHCNLSRTLKKKGDVIEATDSARRAIRLRPGYVKAYQQLTSLLADSGDLDELIDCFRQLLKLDPNSPGMPSSTTSFTVGTILSSARRDQFLQYDAWGRLSVDAANTLVYTGSGTDYTYNRNPYKTVYTYDATGRRISEQFYDRTNTTTTPTSTQYLMYDMSGNVIEVDLRLGTGSRAFYEQFVYSVASPGMIDERDDIDPSSGTPRRIWVLQGPDKSVWETAQQSGGSLDHENYLYTPTGQIVIIDPISGSTPGYTFGLTGKFQMEYLWEGGRAHYDVDYVDPNNTGSSINFKLDGMYWLNGREYDAGQGGAPLAVDFYAYKDTSTGINAKEFSKRTYIQTTWVGDGTMPSYLPSLHDQLMWERDTGDLQAMFTFGLTFASSIGNEIGGMYMSVLNPIQTVGNFASNVSSVYNRVTGNSNDLATEIFGAGTALAYGAGSLVGATQLAEGIYGQDFATGQNLSTADRWARGLGGFGNLALMGAGALGSGEGVLGEAAGAERPLLEARRGFTETLFPGGLDAAAAHFDPVLQNLFEEQGVGEFQGLWLKREMKGAARFDDQDLAIYFQRDAYVTGRVVGEEVQHAIDFAFGADTDSIMNAAAAQGIDVGNAEQLGTWWHRRVFVRQIQNITANRFGMGVLTPYLTEIYAKYAEVGGSLTMEQIGKRSFSGLY